MTRAWITAVVAVLLLCRPDAQQTGLTEAQIKSAEAEMPQLAQLLELRPGMTVADVGAGFGAWTSRFSRLVGPSGRVYATDLGAPQLEALRASVARDGLSNVTVIAGGVAASNLPAGCCDAVLIRDAYHHFTQPADMVRSVAAALKPGGRLAVVDFPPRSNTEVPAGVPSDRGGHGVPPAVIEREVGVALRHIRTIPEWSSSSQPASLFLVLFQKAS